MGFTVALTGDSIITRRISVCQNERFTEIVKILRNAHVAYTHLETTIHDYEEPYTYPAAEAGWTWLRSPRLIVDELKWAGFNIVSLASNHSLDYSYGGMFSTIQALKEVGLEHAGTGINLGEARAPVYRDTEKGRVALISACSSFARWARAGEARFDMKGRPGVNPLRYNYQVDLETLKTMINIARKMGWWITKVGNEWHINPPGLHNTLYRFVESKKEGIHMVADKDDVEANLRSIREAKRQADLVLMHLHTHEWDPDKDLSVPAEFVRHFAYACIDEGANIFIAEGSHAPLRGIEIYKGVPIFYDPGDFIVTQESVTKLPSDFYWRPGYESKIRRWDATPSDAFTSRSSMPPPLNPVGSYWSAPILGVVLVVCSFTASMKLKEIELYPVVYLDEPRAYKGLPVLALNDTSLKIIDYLNRLCIPYGTKIDFKEGVGRIKLI